MGVSQGEVQGSRQVLGLELCSGGRRGRRGMASGVEAVRVGGQKREGDEALSLVLNGVFKSHSWLRLAAVPCAEYCLHVPRMAQSSVLNIVFF